MGRYPDGSVYTGSWAAGKKDGPGVYWDVAKGCLRGSWSKGVLKGHAVYDQPALHYEGEFVQVSTGGGRSMLVCFLCVCCACLGVLCQRSQDALMHHWHSCVIGTHASLAP